MKIYYSKTQIVIRHCDWSTLTIIGKAYKRSDPNHQKRMLDFIDSPIVRDVYCISMPRSLFEYAKEINHNILKNVFFTLCSFS